MRLLAAVIAVVLFMAYVFWHAGRWMECESEGGAYVEAFPIWECVDEQRDL